MRPPGGYTPDMMNYANDINVYQVWADMVCFDKGFFDPEQRPYAAVHASRRRSGNYCHSIEDIFAAYEPNIQMYEEMPAALAGAMGDFVFIARFDTEDAAKTFAQYVAQKAED